MEPSQLLQETMYNPNMIISVLHGNKQLFIYIYILNSSKFQFQTQTKIAKKNVNILGC